MTIAVLNFLFQYQNTLKFTFSTKFLIEKAIRRQTEKCVIERI